MYRCGAHSAVTAVLASAVALMASTNATTIARGRQQIFRTGVDHVRVDVVVTDRTDKPVAGLSAKDFIVLDRGVQQTIDEFEMAGVPPSAGTHSADAPPDLPIAADDAARQNRAWVLLVDDLHIVESEIVQTKRVLSRCLQAIPANDDVALVFVNRSDLGVNFTRERAALEQAVAKVSEALGFGNDAAGTGLTVFADARTSANMLRDVASTLRDVTGVRRIIVYIGEQPAIDPNSSDGRAYLDELRDAFDAARRSDTPIYSIDPRGGVTPEEAVRGGISVISDRNTRSKIASNIRFQQDWLSALAVNTGGRAFINRSNLPAVVDEMVSENTSFYVLGYDAQPATHDGRFHPIRVEVRRKGLRVRARPGYVAPATD
jgi:VWFA-related protein